MRSLAIALSWLLLTASVVVAWKTTRGDFVGMDLFPTVFAAVATFAALLTLVLGRSRPAAWLPALAAIGVAVFAAVTHERVLDHRRSAAESSAKELWLGRTVNEVGFHRAWNLQGDARSLDVSRGVVLLNFWGTWCTPCVEEMPELDAAWERFRGSGVKILGLTTDFSDGGPAGLATADSEIERFLADVPVGYPILLLPPDAFADFGIQNYPTTLRLDDGVVTAVKVGIAGTRELLARLASELG